MNAIRDYILLAVIYLLLVILLPANKVLMHSYHLTPSQYHILYLTVAIPLVAIWFAAFYGYGKLAEYTHLIRKTPEGEGFNNLARGTAWLAWSLPIGALVQICANAIANNHPGFEATSIIITNYTILFFALLAFTAFARGARSLTSLSQVRLDIEQSRFTVLILLVLGVGYCFFAFKSLDLHSLTSTSNPYDIPGWLLITTIIIPYLYAWFSGLIAAIELLIYSKRVSGVLYRQSMGLLASGCLAIIGGSVSAQYLQNVGIKTGHLSLNSTLVIVNMMYLFMAAGYILLTIGAQRLKKMEEV
jgi:hypothetical protein